MSEYDERVAKQVATHLWKKDGEPQKDYEPTSVGRAAYERAAVDIMKGLTELGYVVSKPKAKRKTS